MFLFAIIMFLHNSGELLETKKNATLKFLLQNIVPGRYYLYMNVEKNKYTITFFPEKNFCRKKNTHIFLILDR